MIYEGLHTAYGTDRLQHIFDCNGNRFERQITDDMEVSFDVYFFRDYLFKPHELGDTFEAFGRDWLIVADNRGWSRSFSAMPESVHAHHTLMFRIEHETSLTLWEISLWRLADPRDSYGLQSLIDWHTKQEV